MAKHSPCQTEKGALGSTQLASYKVLKDPHKSPRTDKVGVATPSSRWGTTGAEKMTPLTKATQGTPGLGVPSQGSFPSAQLTHRKSVHPAPPVGRKLHGHPRGCKGVDQCPLGHVSPRSKVQHGLCAAHVEPPRCTGVPLWWLHHVLQDICRLPWGGGGTERKHRVTVKTELGGRSAETDKDLGERTC